MLAVLNIKKTFQNLRSVLCTKKDGCPRPGRSRSRHNEEPVGPPSFKVQSSQKQLICERDRFCWRIVYAKYNVMVYPFNHSPPEAEEASLLYDSSRIARATHLPKFVCLYTSAWSENSSVASSLHFYIDSSRPNWGCCPCMTSVFTCWLSHLAGPG